MSLRTIARLALLLVAAVLLAACGGGDDGGTKGSKDAAGAGADATPELGDEKVIERPKVATPIELSIGAAGPLKLNAAATLAAATKAFGPPDVKGPGDSEPQLCVATWGELGLTLAFERAGATADVACRRGIVPGAYVTGKDWQSSGGGLHVGDEEAVVSRAHARARKQKLPASAQRALGIEQGWVLDFAPSDPALYAAVRDGKVAALVYTRSAT